MAENRVTQELRETDLDAILELIGIVACNEDVFNATAGVDELPKLAAYMRRLAIGLEDAKRVMPDEGRIGFLDFTACERCAWVNPDFDEDCGYVQECGHVPPLERSGGAVHCRGYEARKKQPGEQ